MATMSNLPDTNMKAKSDTEERLNLISRHISGPHTTVIVGANPSRTFKLPRSLLIDRSPYFKACLTSGLVESFENKVELLDISPDTFCYFVHWLYTSQLTACDEADNLDLWVLADRLMCEDLKNMAMNLLRIYCRSNNLDLKEVTDVCGRLPTSSTLIKFCCMQVACDWYEADYSHEGRDRSELTELLNVSGDVSWKILEHVRDFGQGELDSGERPCLEPGCQWHDHEDSDIDDDSCPTPCAEDE